jgi:hypothetical protein
VRAEDPSAFAGEEHHGEAEHHGWSE